MIRHTSYIFSIAQLLVLLLSLVTDWNAPLVYSINIIALLMMLEKLGRGIVLREIIAFHSCFICLLMPLFGYLFYNYQNALARITFRYMPIPEDVYFNYALPAVTAFSLFLCWPIHSQKSSDQGLPLQILFEKVKEILKGNQRYGIYLLIAGIIISIFVQSLPTSLQYIFTLFYFSAFAGSLYVFFSESFRFKKLILLSFALFILAASLRNGMFTIIAYMGMTMFSFFFIGKKIALWKKLVSFMIAVFFIALIQSVKPDYRKTLKQDYEANKVEAFTNLIAERVSNLNKFITPDAFFLMHYRANQGFNMALVMRKFPGRTPHDNGSRLMVVLASAFVPRILWQNKPEAGGVANMKYYAGVKIAGWSTNVGPLGEAYASFGVTGGIIFMILLGLFIRFAYIRVFIIAQKIPLIILWIPVLFYQITYSAENDTLQILNSLIKSAFFIFILYKFVPKLFRPVQSRSSVQKTGPSPIVRELQTS